MVEKKVKQIDAGYYTRNAIEKEFIPLFINAQTRESEELIETENCKKTIDKKETKKTSYDLPSLERSNKV